MPEKAESGYGEENAPDINVDSATDYIRQRYKEALKTKQGEMLARRKTVWEFFNDMLDNRVNEGILTSDETNEIRAMQTALLELNQRIDAKTGALTAGAFLEEVELAIKHTAETGESLSILIIDMDNFKKINDEYGHLAGDAVLVGTAHHLRGILPESAHFGRFGGDEFMALIQNKTHEEVEEIKKKGQEGLTDSLREVIIEPELMKLIHISIGESHHIPGQTSQEFIHEGDQKMYVNKNNYKKQNGIPPR